MEIDTQQMVNLPESSCKLIQHLHTANVANTVSTPQLDHFAAEHAASASLPAAKASHSLAFA
jgi:hypothetical protein